MPYRLPQSGTFPCCSHLGTHLGVSGPVSAVLPVGESRWLEGRGHGLGGSISLHRPASRRAIFRDGDMGWVGAFLYTERPQGEPHSGAISMSPELDCLKLKCPFPKGWPCF